MILNKRAKEEFEGGDAGFISYIRTLQLEDLEQMIDERMDITETTLYQIKQALSIALMCMDKSNGEQPSLGHILNNISRAYKASLAFPSAKHRIVHGDRVKGHKRVQFR